jgi:hypothetical protein
MKFAIALAAVIIPIALGGCMGPEGNPNGMAYANEPGGAIAAQPQNLGTVSYDPSAPVAPFEDMKASAVIGGQNTSGTPSYGAPEQAPARNR